MFAEINYCLQHDNPCTNSGMCRKNGESYVCECAASSKICADSAQCRDTPGDMMSRVNCGWSNVQEVECSARSCCFDGSQQYSTLPACFFTGTFNVLIFDTH